MTGVTMKRIDILKNQAYISNIQQDRGGSLSFDIHHAYRGLLIKGLWRSSLNDIIVEYRLENGYLSVVIPVDFLLEKESYFDLFYESIKNHAKRIIDEYEVRRIKEEMRVFLTSTEYVKEVTMSYGDTIRFICNTDNDEGIRIYGDIFSNKSVRMFIEYMGETEQVLVLYRELKNNPLETMRNVKYLAHKLRFERSRI